jgi:tetratricopeptide (TPR) repeat protein
VLALAPDHREALDLIGFVLFFLERSAEAEPFVRRAVELYPDHAYCWKGLGMHLVRLGRHDEGFSAIERATELRPDWFDPHWDYLVMALRVGSQARFDAMFDRARSRFPQEAARLAALLRQAPAAP